MGCCEMEKKLDALRLEVEGEMEKLKQFALNKTEELLDRANKQIERLPNVKDGSSLASSANFTEDEINELDKGTQLKPESKFTHKDWYNRSTALIAKKDYQGALDCVEKALMDGELLSAMEEARYLFRKAICYLKLGRSEQEIEAYNELVGRFKSSKETEIQVLVAKTLLNKGITLREQEQFDKAIIVYDDLIEKFKASDEPVIQETVARALLNKGFAFGQQGQFDKAIIVYDGLIDQFKASEVPVIQEHVLSAMANAAELAILVEGSSSVLNRISFCESLTDNLKILSAMSFLRFIVDDKPIQTVVESIEKIPEDEKLTWSFDEIRDFIETQFSGEKLSQCQAVMRYFEEHQDKVRLKTELGA